MIQIRDLSVHYGSILALQLPHLDISEGECVLINGPSGCGKSTLARVLSGLIPHTIPALLQGTVRIAGLDVREHSVADLAQHVGAVFQNPATQLFHLRVEDDVAFGPRNLGLDDEQVSQRADWAMDAVGITALRNCNPAELSGGQKQLVAIAAALAMRPQILVLDEPTASLDITGTVKVVTALRELQRKTGITIVLIEHRLAEMAQLAERIVVMDQGQIVLDDALDKALGDRHFLRQMGLRRPVDAPLTRWESLLVPNGRPPSGVAPLVSLQGVSAGYNGKAVIEDVNLALYPGDFAALVGDNGAGKSTLALVAAGLLKPAEGSLSYAGQKRPRPGLDVSLLFQDPTEQLFADTVDEEVSFGPRNYRLFSRDNHEVTLAETDLLGLRARGPVALSMGQQQRTALAACLSLRPRLLILDEPTLGQDWGHLQRLMDFLTTLNQHGVTILLITHDYKLIPRYARRVVLIQKGRIVLDGHLLDKEARL
jgi:energy-coupling factor transport system ATP-binding protein